MNFDGMNQYVAMALVISPFAVYLVARLVSAAFFQSKQQYERQFKNDTRTK